MKASANNKANVTYAPTHVQINSAGPVVFRHMVLSGSWMSHCRVTELIALLRQMRPEGRMVEDVVCHRELQLYENNP